jgi:hypothetical protein
MTERLEIIIAGKDEFSKAFGKLKSALPSIKTLAIGAGAAVAGMGTALVAMTKSTAEAYDKIQKFSDQLGISTEFISKMQHAAELSGVKNLNKGLQMLQVRIGEAARGIGQGKDALESLGVTLYDTNGQLKTAEGIMPALAAAFHNMSNATERAEAASKIFGQRGIEMVQMFKDGREGLVTMTAEAEKFGLVISAQAGANAAAFNDSLTRVQGSLKGLKNAIAEQVMPIITGLANRFADFVADNRDEIIAFGLKFVDVMANILEYVGYAVAGLIDAWRGLQMVWHTLKIAFAEFARILLEGLDWILAKHLAVMERLNFRGIFDEMIAKAENFQTKMGEAISYFENASSTAWGKLNALVDEGMAVGKVKAFADAARQMIAEIQASGQATVAAPKVDMPVIDISGQAKAMRELQAMHDQYYLSESQRLDKWYQHQQAKYAENKEALAMLDDIYRAKQNMLAEADRNRQQSQLEQLKQMHSDYLLTRGEQLEEWYQKQQDIYAEQKEALSVLDEIYHERKRVLEEQSQAQQDAMRQAQFKGYSDMLTSMQHLSKIFGKKGFEFFKGLSIAQATIKAIEAFNTNLAAYAYPLGPIMGALALATGLAQVATMAAMQPAGTAHGGLTNVPREQTYLLDKGERVMSPRQNADLIEFMNKRGGAETIIVENQNNYIEVLPNATNAQALLDMDEREMEEVAEEKIIPALRRLKSSGITHD